MPTKRKRVTRGRRGVVTLNTLPFRCLLEFLAGWSPPAGFEQHARWVTWAHFMADWLAVRGDFMQHSQWGQGDVFAENVYKVFGAKGPPSHYGYDDVLEAIAAAEDDAAAELLADVAV